MRRFGLFLLLMGVGSFVLPLFGMQFVLLDFAGEEAIPFIGAGLAIAGGIMVLVSLRTKAGATPDVADANRPPAVPQAPDTQDSRFQKGP
jgi:hypothetical protein